MASDITLDRFIVLRNGNMSFGFKKLTQKVTGMENQYQSSNILGMGLNASKLLFVYLITWIDLNIVHFIVFKFIKCQI